MKRERAGEHPRNERARRHRLSGLLPFRRRHPAVAAVVAAPVPVHAEVEDLAEVLAAW